MFVLILVCNFLTLIQIVCFQGKRGKEGNPGPFGAKGMIGEKGFPGIPGRAGLKVKPHFNHSLCYTREMVLFVWNAKT